MDIKLATPTFAALANETRLSVFKLLVEAGPDGLSAGEVAEQLDVVQNTMSSHLSILNQCDLVSKERVGRSLIYRANYKTMSTLITFLLQDCCKGSSDVTKPVSAALACC